MTLPQLEQCFRSTGIGGLIMSQADTFGRTIREHGTLVIAMRFIAQRTPNPPERTQPREAVWPSLEPGQAASQLRGFGPRFFAPAPPL